MSSNLNTKSKSKSIAPPEIIVSKAIKKNKERFSQESAERLKWNRSLGNGCYCCLLQS